MTITVAPARNEYTASAGQTVFNYTFKIFADTDLNVYVTPAGQECSDSDLTTDYFVLDVGEATGGTVNFFSGLNDGDLVTIVAAIPSDRTTDYQNNGDFRPDTVNEDFDRVISIVKKIEDKVSRAPALSECYQGNKPLKIDPPETGKALLFNGTKFVNFLPSSTLPTVPENEVVGAFTDYVFKSVSDAKIGLTIGGYLVNLLVGQLIKTVNYYGNTSGGGAAYTVVTGGTGTEDGGRYHNLSNGLQLELVVDSDYPDVRQFGATVDTGTDSTTAIANYMAYTNGVLRLPKGKLYVTSLPDLATFNSGNHIQVIGEGIDESELQVLTGLSTGILFDNFKVGAEFKNFSVKQVDAYNGAVTKIGKCFDSDASGAAFVQWDNVRTFGFDIVGEVRQSVWCTIGFLECKEYGLKPLCFVKELKDGSAPTGGWNIFPNGWFNNSLTVENYLCRNGVNGPVFEGSSISIDTLTTEGLTGDGLFLRGVSSSDKIRTISINNLYAENIVGTSIVCSNVANGVINNLFQQGKGVGDASTAVVNLNEAYLKINNVSGQDWYTNGAILNNNSVLDGEVSGAIVGGNTNKYVVDATSEQRPYNSNPFVKYFKSATLNDQQSITCTDAVPSTDANYSVKIGIIYNGSVFEVQDWTVWKFDGTTSKIQQNSNGSSRLVDLSITGSDLIVKNNQGAQSMVFTITVVDYKALAGG